MSKKTVNVSFNIGDKVKVKELNIKGKVSGIYIDAAEVSYKVRYFFESKPQEVYFCDYELEKVIEDETASCVFKT